jgi:5-deoxy-glucuronate isomerase
VILNLAPRDLMSSRPVRFHTRSNTVEVHSRGSEWRYLGFEVVTVEVGRSLELETAGRETAVVTVSGSGLAEVGPDQFFLSRAGVFTGMTSVLYIPPDVRTRMTAISRWCVALGSAPASGRYPVRLIEPREVRVEVRGGGAARRQVNHLLAHPLPAERLIAYEVYVPGGAWAGWPPHRHDGSHGSPYLEEVYYFSFNRVDGFGFHRNYDTDGSFDEVLAVRDRDCVDVKRGFHVTAAAPGHNMWILNFLAGELIGEQRRTPPYFDPSTTWIVDDWSRGLIELPFGVPSETAAP